MSYNHLMDILLLLILCGGGWFWLDTVAKRDTAIAHGRALASKFQLQLLDESVACVQLGFARNTRGRLLLKRTYHFEISADGLTRHACQLTLLGNQLHDWTIPPYEVILPIPTQHQNPYH